MGIDQDFLAALQTSYRSILTVADQLNPEPVSYTHLTLPTKA